MDKASALLLILLVIFGYFAWDAFQRNNSSQLQASGIAAYWDSACTNKATTINWGVLSPGSTAREVIFVLNCENTSIVLSLETNNWNPPSASSYITLGWNYAGQVVPVNGVIQVTLELSASILNVETDFWFDIVITGTGVELS